MTKEKILKLLKKYYKKEIKVEDIIEFKELSDEEIDIVLANNNKQLMIELLKNKNFRILQKEVKEEILLIVRQLREGSIYLPYILKAISNKTIINSNELLEIINFIIRSKGPHQADKIIKIASNENVHSTGNLIELCKSIYRYSKSLEQLNIATIAATDSHIIRSGLVIDIVKEILKAPNQNNALNLYYKYKNNFKEKELLDALSSGIMQEIDFWELLSENPEKAIDVLIQITSSEEIDPNTKLIKTRNLQIK